MKDQPLKINLHDRLILAGIDELNQNGLHNFSVRRIANRCGVSCAAPYKHFEDRRSFIAAIIEYIYDQWNERQREVIRHTTDLREQIVEISLAYIRFLVENPNFRSIIMFKYEEFDQKYYKLRGRLSMQSHTLVERYCKMVNMPEAVKTRKLYVVRSLIYGAALMFDNGEMEYNSENMQYVSDSIDREFDLQ